MLLEPFLFVILKLNNNVLSVDLFLFIMLCTWWAFLSENSHHQLWEVIFFKKFDRVFPSVRTTLLLKLLSIRQLLDLVKDLKWALPVFPSSIGSRPSWLPHTSSYLLQPQQLLCHPPKQMTWLPISLKTQKHPGLKKLLPHPHNYLCLHLHPWPPISFVHAPNTIKLYFHARAHL